eukprot:2655952-Lingulodinium_polyedra.AAC.1
MEANRPETNPHTGAAHRACGVGAQWKRRKTPDKTRGRSSQTWASRPGAPAGPANRATKPNAPDRLVPGGRGAN